MLIFENNWKSYGSAQALVKAKKDVLTVLVQKDNGDLKKNVALDLHLLESSASINWKGLYQMESFSCMVISSPYRKFLRYHILCLE